MKKIKTLSLITLSLAFVGTGAIVASSLQNSNSEEAKVTKKIRSIGESVENGLKIKDVAAGDGFALATIIDQVGNESLYSWGSNEDGRMGIGSNTSIVATPTKVLIPTDYKIKSIEAGSKNGAAIATDTLGGDHLYMWGSNDGSVLTDDSVEQVSPVEIDLPKGGEIKQVDIGVSSVGAVITDTLGNDSLYTWGRNSEGQLGIGDTVGEDISTPTMVSTLPESETIKSFKFGGFHAGAITTDSQGNDSLYMWGQNTNGQITQLGDDDKTYTPIRVDGAFPVSGEISNFSLGLANSSASIIDSNGISHIYSWGRNGYGELGNGDDTEQLINETPIEIFTSSEYEISNMNFSNFHTSSVVLTNSNGVDSMYMWGNNSDGQLGNGGSANSSTPIVISLPEGEIVDTDLGYYSSYAVVRDEFGNDKLYSWGRNWSGELGFGYQDGEFIQPSEGRAVNGLVKSISTTLIEQISEKEFVFEIQVPDTIGFNADDVEIYNSNGVKLGETNLVVDETPRTTSYRFNSVVSKDDANNDNVYWSTNNGETLNLISTEKFVYFEEDNSNNAILFSTLGVVGLILLILLIIFVILLLTKDKNKDEEDYLQAEEKKSKKSKKQRKQDEIDQRNNVLDAL